MGDREGVGIGVGNDVGVGVKRACVLARETLWLLAWVRETVGQCGQGSQIRRWRGC
jgi:hypothetical protein